MSARIGGSAAALFLLGLGLAAGLIAWHGAGEVAQALARAGWGLLAVAVFHLAVLALDTLGFRAVIAARHRPGYARLLWLQWIAEAVNTLLPVAQIGGEAVKARLLALGGVPGPRSGAAVVVNLTLGVAAQALFTLLGLALLIVHAGAGGLAGMAALGVGLFASLLGGFFLAQRFGLFQFLSRIAERLIAGREGWRLAGGARRLDAAIRERYRRHRAVASSVAWQFAGWVLGAGEVWLILHFMGAPVSLVEAVLLESLGQAVRAAGFIVPAALGIQEGGFLLLGAAVGLAPETALALSLGKRARELALGLPALIGWQTIEARRLLTRRGPR